MYLKDSQARAAELLASGYSGKAVAEQVGVTPETICRWKKEPVFRAELNLMTEEVRAIAKAKLASMVGLALDVIADSLQNEPDRSQRVRTAFGVLKLVNNERLGLPERPLLTQPENLRKAAHNRSLHLMAAIHRDGGFDGIGS